MLLHYLGKVNSSTSLQITTKKIKKRVVFDKNEMFTLSYGWLEIGVIVFYSICSKCLPFVCMHAWRRLHHSSIALSMMLWSTLHYTCCTVHTPFQFVSVVHLQLVHSLLDDAPNPVINRIKVRAVRWLVERTPALLEKSHIVACRWAGALSCWRTKISRYLSHHE